MSEVKNIPRLRFLKYNKPLSNVSFADLGKIMIGLTHKPVYIETGRPFLSSKNISQGFIDFENIKYISEDEFQNLPKGSKPIKGDILFTRVGSNLGNPIVLDVSIEFGIFVSLGTFRVNHNANNYFIKYWMDTNYFWRQLEQKVAGGAKNNLNTTWLKEFRLNLPSLPEQQKIADFLTAADKRIELLEKKKNLLETYKKGVMKKIFNQEIRFKDDNGSDFPDWEEKRLGSVCKIQGGYAFKSISFEEVGIPIIRISNISNDNDQLNLKNLVYYDEIPNEESYIINKGDLLIAMSGATTGKTSISDYNGKCYLNQRVGLFKIKSEKLNYSFLVQYVFSSMFRSQLLSYLVAGAQPNISSKDIESVTIPLPSFQEQIKISELLNSIGVRVELLDTQIDKAKTWKKGLLQKMFV